jgi:hypothetical protein
MFLAGLLLTIRRHCCVYTAVDMCHVFMLTGCWQDRDGTDYTNCCLYTVVPSDDGFGGLVFSMLASGSQVRGFEPDRSRWIFSDVKKSSACLSSEGK